MAATAYFYASADNSGQTSTDNLVRMFARPLSNSSGGPDPNPTTMGAELATEINAASEDTIWIFPNKLVEVLDDTAAATAASVGDMLINGPDMGLRYQRFTLMMQALYDGLDDPTVIAGLHLDEEPSFFGNLYSYYALGGSHSERGTAMYNALQNPSLGRYFPAYMRELTEGQLQGFTDWNGDVGSRYAVDWDKVMLAKSRDAIQGFADIFAGVFGYTPGMVANYDDEHLIRTRKYSSGQPVGAGTRTIGGVSQPALWLAGDSQAVFSGLTKPNWWNSLITALNWVRSLRGRIVPQISRPGVDGDSNPVVTNYDLWDELMAHLGAMGIDTFIGFVAGWGSTDKNHMQSVLAGLEIETDLPSRYELIPYDADSITTNGVTTEYASSLGTGRVTS